VSIPNLLDAWNEFKRGKRKKPDVADFELHLEDRIFRLHRELMDKTYTHDPYFDFYVCDPKRRHIHKATVRDRVLHQAIFRALYPIFDKHFIYDSYSSRNYKGTHAGVARLISACRKETKNWRQNAYALKCDIRKFFDSIDHKILRELIIKKVTDPDLLWLIDIIFESFEKQSGKGLPLGNVTSQLFANIYLNELDQFAKHVLKARYFFRYCDDFVIVDSNKTHLQSLLPRIHKFLADTLQMELHPNKVEIRKIQQGVDFLGYVVLPHAMVVRTHTKQRIIRKMKQAYKDFIQQKISKETFENKKASFLGVLSHGRNRKLSRRIKNMI
jgi:retron-type reverse transcriptase